MAISRADCTREALGLSSAKSKQPKNAPPSRKAFEQKSMIIKAQVPVDPFAPTASYAGLGGLLVYNKRKVLCALFRGMEIQLHMTRSSAQRDPGALEE
jgi:hypothetical protein